MVIDGSFDPRAFCHKGHGRYAAVVSLCWLAPSTRKRLSSWFGATVRDLSDLVVGDVGWGKEACGLASRVYETGPLYRGLPWRSYLAEQLYREALMVIPVLQVVRHVEAVGEDLQGREIVVEGVLQGFPSRLLVEVLGERPGVRCLPWKASANAGGQGDGGSYVAKLRRRVRDARLTGDWSRHLADFLEWGDKSYTWRVRWGRLRGKRVAPAGKITFFSSYSNNTRTLRPFAGLMPEAPWWVLTNRSAKTEMSKGDKRWSWIWEWSGEGRAGRDMEEGRGEPCFPCDTDGTVRAWMGLSPSWRTWREVEFATVRNLTLCWEAYLEGARPSLVVMANQWGIEGWFAHVARRRGIPVLQVIHGVLGGYFYTQTPIVSDAMVVPGEFWRGLWPEEERSKIMVFNPPGYIDRVERTLTSGRPRLTYFSWPLKMVSSYSFFELTDGLVGIFQRLLEKGRCEITIRAHPLENPADFMERWSELYGEVPPGVRLSKAEPLRDVLACTDVALMFRSTVMLNCMAGGIPVIMPGWIDFGWNETLHDVPGIHLASDFEDLEATLLDWMDHPPEVDMDLTRKFVMRAGEGVERFRSLVQGLMRPCSVSPAYTAATDPGSLRTE